MFAILNQYVVNQQNIHKSKMANVKHHFPEAHLNIVWFGIISPVDFI